MRKRLKQKEASSGSGKGGKRSDFIIPWTIVPPHSIPPFRTPTNGHSASRGPRSGRTYFRGQAQGAQRHEREAMRAKGG